MTLNINPSVHLNRTFSLASPNRGFLQNGFNNLSKKTGGSTTEHGLGLKVNLSALQNTSFTNQLTQESVGQLLRAAKADLSLHKLSAENVSRLL